MPNTDSAVRAITNDYAFRVIAIESTQMVARALEVQGATGTTARLFADVLSGTVLVRETMAPALRVQGIVKGARSAGTLVGDSRPGGGTRGLVQLPKDGSEFQLGEGSLMQVMRSLPNGSIHQGLVSAHQDGGISGALMVYLQESEQVASVVAVGAHFMEDRLVRAGGYLVQLLPEVERKAGIIMSQRLEDFPPIEEFLLKDEFSPRFLLEEILYAMPYTELETSAVSFECPCSETSLLTAMASLGRADLEELVASDESLEIQCDYCRTDYELAPERLRTLLSES